MAVTDVCPRIAHYRERRMVLQQHLAHKGDITCKGVVGLTEDASTNGRPKEHTSLCMLWCAPGLQRGDWAHAFAVLRP